MGLKIPLRSEALRYRPYRLTVLFISLSVLSAMSYFICVLGYGYAIEHSIRFSDFVDTVQIIVFLRNFIDFFFGVEFEGGLYGEYATSGSFS
jgi:hypothetical protein